MTELTRREATIEVDLHDIEQQALRHTIEVTAAAHDIEVSTMPLEIEVIDNGKARKATPDLVSYNGFGGMELMVLRAATKKKAHWYVVRRHKKTDELFIEQYRITSPNTGESIQVGLLALGYPQQL